MENKFKLTIMTPDKEFFNGEVVKLNSEDSDGRFLSAWPKINWR